MDVLSCFREIDRSDVVDVPQLTGGVTTWAVGSRVFLVFEDGDKTKGIVFHRDNASLPAVATMCQWCHRVRGHGGVKMLSVRASDRRWVGQYLCADLDCMHSETSVDDLRESLDHAQRNVRTLERIKLFASRCVF